MRQYQSRLGVQGVYPANSRRGFTLIELLIVMVIILLLSGMLLGAVILVRARVVQAQQIAELSQIDIALTNFKAKYGIYPPSRIRLRNWVAVAMAPYANNASSVSEAYAMDNPFDVHSIAYLRRIWPSIKLPIAQTTGGALIEQPNSNLIWYVDNSSAQEVAHTPLDLEGDQCLVFFLGGIAERRGTNEFVLHGFRDNSTNPTDIPNATNPQSLARTQPFYNFDASRLYVRYDNSALIDTGVRYAEQSSTTGSITITDFYLNNSTPGTAGYLGRLPSYKVINADTSYPLPVAYFSSYEGRGYRPDDVNIPEPADAGNGTNFIAFQLTWPLLTTTANTPISLEPNPYTRNAAGPVNRTGAGATTSVIQCYNPKTYQIILPGPDNLYGAGGSQLDYSGDGWSENDDNIANFAGGSPVGQFVTQQQK